MTRERKSCWTDQEGAKRWILEDLDPLNQTLTTTMGALLSLTGKSAKKFTCGAEDLVAGALSSRGCELGMMFIDDSSLHSGGQEILETADLAQRRSPP